MRIRRQKISRLSIAVGQVVEMPLSGVGRSSRTAEPLQQISLERLLADKTSGTVQEEQADATSMQAGAQRLPGPWLSQTPGCEC